MRTSIKILALIVLNTIIVSSCKKHTNNPPFIPVGFSAKINNVLWVPANYSASTNLWVGSTGDSVLSLDVEATDVNNKGLDIYMYNYKTIGTYNVYYNTTNSISYYYSSANPVLYSSAVSGSVTITKSTSNNIQGIFNAIVYVNSDTLMITEGQFNVPLN